MDNRIVVDRIMRNLDFDLETVSNHKIDHDNCTTSTKPNPLNVRIRVRKKDIVDEHISKGFISNNQSDPTMVLQKIRLVNSNATIMSFDMLMEAKTEKKTSRKLRKQFFDMLRPGFCLKAADDDEEPYMLSSSYNGNVTKSGSANNLDGILKQQFTLTKNTYNTFGVSTDSRREKNFLGIKCRPGGCLDPPFDEDRYPYKPRVQDQLTNDTQNATNPVAVSKLTDDKAGIDMHDNKSPEDNNIKNKIVSTKTVSPKTSDLMLCLSKVEKKRSIITKPPDYESKSLGAKVCDTDKNSNYYRSKPFSEEKSQYLSDDENNLYNSRLVSEDNDTCSIPPSENKSGYLPDDQKIMLRTRVGSDDNKSYKSKLSCENKYRQSVNEYMNSRNSFFNPPKGVKRESVQRDEPIRVSNNPIKVNQSKEYLRIPTPTSVALDKVPLEHVIDSRTVNNIYSKDIQVSESLITSLLNFNSNLVIPISNQVEPNITSSCIDNIDKPYNRHNSKENLTKHVEAKKSSSNTAILFKKDRTHNKNSLVNDESLKTHEQLLEPVTKMSKNESFKESPSLDITITKSNDNIDTTIYDPKENITKPLKAIDAISSLNTAIILKKDNSHNHNSLISDANLEKSKEQLLEPSIKTPKVESIEESSPQAVIITKDNYNIDTPIYDPKENLTEPLKAIDTISFLNTAIIFKKDGSRDQNSLIIDEKLTTSKEQLPEPLFKKPKVESLEESSPQIITIPKDNDYENSQIIDDRSYSKHVNTEQIEESNKRTISSEMIEPKKQDSEKHLLSSNKREDKVEIMNAILKNDTIGTNEIKYHIKGLDNVTKEVFLSAERRDAQNVPVEKTSLTIKDTENIIMVDKHETKNFKVKQDPINRNQSKHLLIGLVDFTEDMTLSAERSNLESISLDNFSHNGNKSFVMEETSKIMGISVKSNIEGPKEIKNLVEGFDDDTEKRTEDTISAEKRYLQDVAFEENILSNNNNGNITIQDKHNIINNSLKTDAINNRDNLIKVPEEITVYIEPIDLQNTSLFDEDRQSSLTRHENSIEIQNKSNKISKETLSITVKHDSDENMNNDYPSTTSETTNLNKYQLSQKTAFQKIEYLPKDFNPLVERYNQVTSSTDKFDIRETKGPVVDIDYSLKAKGDTDNHIRNSSTSYKEPSIQENMFLSNREGCLSPIDIINRKKKLSKTISSENDFNAIYLDLAFHSYLNNSNERILNTIDPRYEIRRFPNDSIVFIKSQVKLTSEESDRRLNVPIDSKHYMDLELKKTNVKSNHKHNEKEYEVNKRDVEDGTELIQNQTVTDLILKLQRRDDSLAGIEEMKDTSHNVHYIKTNENNKIGRTLTDIYEQELIPLQMMITNLKQEIDDLAAQQTLLKKNVVCLKRVNFRK